MLNMEQPLINELNSTKNKAIVIEYKVVKNVLVFPSSSWVKLSGKHDIAFSSCNISP